MDLVRSLPGMMSFMITSLGCWICQTKKAVLFRGIILRVVCCSDTQGWLGFPWPLCLKRGWAKTCATLPCPLSCCSLQFLVFLLRGEAHAKGAGVKAGTQRSWGARRAGLDAGASAAYLASPSSRKNRSGQPQARGAAPQRATPPTRPARPPPVPRHIQGRRPRSASTEACLARHTAFAGGQKAVAVLLVRAARPGLDARVLRQYIAKPGQERESPQRDNGRGGGAAFIPRGATCA